MRSTAHALLSDPVLDVDCADVALPAPHRGDLSIPASGVSRGQALLLADRAAAAHLDALP